MAIQAYLKVKANGNDIAGSSVDTKSHGDWCDVVTYEMGAEVNLDRISGQATGRRQHKPLTVVKPLDKASPMLFQALVQNQEIEATLEFWRDKRGSGGREKYYTYKITKGRVVALSQFAADDEDPKSNKGAQEKVSFVFDKIIVTWVDGGIEAEDHWTDSEI